MAAHATQNDAWTQLNANLEQQVAAGRLSEAIEALLAFERENPESKRSEEVGRKVGELNRVRQTTYLVDQAQFKGLFACVDTSAGDFFNGFRQEVAAAFENVSDEHIVGLLHVRQDPGALRFGKRMVAGEDVCVFAAGVRRPVYAKLVPHLGRDEFAADNADRGTAGGHTALARFARVLPEMVHVCHPRIWTIRELPEAVHQQLGRGEVRFDVDRGGAGQSLTGDPGKMVQFFGPPQVSLEVVIDRAVKAVG